MAWVRRPVLSIPFGCVALLALGCSGASGTSSSGTASEGGAAASGGGGQAGDGGGTAGAGNEGGGAGQAGFGGDDGGAGTAGTGGDDGGGTGGAAGAAGTAGGGGAAGASGTGGGPGGTGGAPQVCKPGDTLKCYGGPPGTENVGICKGGLMTCDPQGTSWGPCVGEVLPKGAEVCGNGLDDDCNGKVDESVDKDGDGWGTCEGDCCDDVGPCSSTPNLVNPGAFEVLNNQVDDDCDPNTKDNVPPADCSTQAKFQAVAPEDVAKAIELCQFTTASPPKDKKIWGVVKAEFLLANGTAPSAAQMQNMQNWQAAILQNYGTGGVAPKKGATMAGISSGKMRDANDPGFVQPNSGTDFASNVSPPAAYLAANGGNLPSSKGCSGNCPAGTGAHDSINVRLTIRVPTNAKSFSYQFRFFSAEYWTWKCTAYNDFYLALLNTKAPGIPADKNISFDANKNPVSVNNAFFEVCVPKTCSTCPGGTAELAGTGMETGNTGGGSKWLTTTAPIVPGEDLQMEFMIFDVSDGILDSLVVLDNWQWDINPAQVGTQAK